MNKERLIKNLELFRDKAFCHHSHYKAGQVWREFAKDIHPEFYWKIKIEWGHVQLGHGFEQACQALNTEIEKYVDFLKHT